MIIHCDAASLGKHTFIIGYKAFQDKHCAYKKIYARSVNEAELAAIDFALSAFPNGLNPRFDGAFLNYQNTTAVATPQVLIPDLMGLF